MKVGETRATRKVAAGARLAALVAASIAGGCGGGGSGSGSNGRPVPLDVAFNKASADDPRRGPLTERPVHAMYNDVSIDPLNLKPTPAESADPSLHASAPPGVIAEPVRQAVQAPTVAALSAATQASPQSSSPPAAGSAVPSESLAVSQPASTAPAAPPPATGASTGQHLTLGALVVEVNNKPIYANDVIQPLVPLLSTKARQLNAQQFRALAMEEISKQLRYLVQDQLEFAIADRSLDTDEKHAARALTERYRDDLVRRSGGSLQLARQRAAAQGIDFDKLVEEQYRVWLRRVYFMKKEWPKVQVRAEDMREYYVRHRDDQFSQRAAARFRVIKIGIRQTGGREPAQKKIDDLRARAAAGDDFAELAGSFNDDPYLLKLRGAVGGEGGWMDRGAYANKKLEEAVWSIEAGYVTPVIEDRDAFFIAKLEEKREARVRPFDDEQVQQKIRTSLENEQFTALREKAQQRLIADAAIYPDPPFIQPAIDIAMQNYPAWAAQRD